MTYEELAGLMSDPVLRGRIKVAAIKYADAILIEPEGPGHASRLKWSQMTYQNPDMVTSQLQPPVVMDPAVQAAGAAVTDIALQGAVEAVVNKTV